MIFFSSLTSFNLLNFQISVKSKMVIFKFLFKGIVKSNAEMLNRSRISFLREIHYKMYYKYLS